MITNLDIERRKALKNTKPENKSLTKFSETVDAEKQTILKSKRFSKFMQKLLKSYSKGAQTVHQPRFVSHLFSSLVVAKFNSYELEYTLIYDFYLRQFIFVSR